jgi:hypothetical protein
LVRVPQAVALMFWSDVGASMRRLAGPVTLTGFRVEAVIGRAAVVCGLVGVPDLGVSGQRRRG